jgi:hypothetical protein
MSTMTRSLIVGAALVLALSAGVARAQTTKTLSNGDVETNQRSLSGGTYNDQRSVTTPSGATASNDRTAGHGQYSDTRTGRDANGGTYNNTRTAGRGGYTDNRSINSAHRSYNSQRYANSGGTGHSWSGTTRGGRSFAGSRAR